MHRPTAVQRSGLRAGHVLEGSGLERATGIEPVSLAWKARVLPLHNARSAVCLRMSPSFTRQDDVAQRMPGEVISLLRAGPASPADSPCTAGPHRPCTNRPDGDDPHSPRPIGRLRTTGLKTRFEERQKRAAQKARPQESLNGCTTLPFNTARHRSGACRDRTLGARCRGQLTEQGDGPQRSIAPCPDTGRAMDIRRPAGRLGCACPLGRPGPLAGCSKSDIADGHLFRSRPCR